MANQVQHPGRAQQPQQEEGYPMNPKLAMTNQASVDEANGRKTRIEGDFQQVEAQKAQQVDELAVAIATGQVGEQELQQLPPELVQAAVEVVQAQQIQNAPAGNGIADEGLNFVEPQGQLQQQAAMPQQDPFDQDPMIAQLAQDIQTGAVTEQELQEINPELVQAAVQMLQGQ